MASPFLMNTRPISQSGRSRHRPSTKSGTPSSHATEDGADELLDGAVRAVRQRLGAAESDAKPIALASGEGARVVLHGTRWSVSAAGTSGVIRGASVALSVVVGE